MESAKFYKYLLIIIAVTLTVSLYFNYSFSNRIQLLEESIKDVEVNCVDDLCNGYRRGLLSSIGVSTREGRWLICYDSFEDDNAGDKNPECCKSIGGTWHEERCCTYGKVNSNWIGQTGQCSETGEWIPK